MFFASDLQAKEYTFIAEITRPIRILTISKYPVFIKTFLIMPLQLQSTAMF